MNTLQWGLSSALECGGSSFIAHGGSMMPIVWPGSVVRVRPIQQRPAVGQCVLAVDDESLVFHRVVGATPAGLLLRGDAQERAIEFAWTELLGVAEGTHVGRWWIPSRLPLPAARWGVSAARCAYSHRERMGVVRSIARSVYQRLQAHV